MNPGRPFFHVSPEGAVRVARPLVGEGEAYELADAARDALLAKACEALARVLPKVGRYENPTLAAADVATLAKSAAAGDVALLFSGPEELEPLAVLESLDACEQPWIGDFAAVAKGLDTLAGAGWTWRVQGLADRVFASNFEPPQDEALVDVRAPGGELRVAKRRAVKVLRKDEPGEQRLVLGIVLEPETVDSQGDVYSAEEIANAAHGWMEHYQTMGLMHEEAAPGVLPVESYLCPVDCEIGGQPVKAGTWLLCVHVIDDAIWAKVKAGELTGFSIGGYAQRVAAQQIGA